MPVDNSPLRQQFTTGAKGISQQLIANGGGGAIYSSGFVH
jgi:hypothetical protein